MIKRIKDEHGVWRETTEEIQGVIESYFTQSFETTSVDGKLTEREVVHKVTEAVNVDLISKVTPEEVKDAAFSMHTEKSPGPEGLNSAFF